MASSLVVLHSIMIIIYQKLGRSGTSVFHGTLTHLLGISRNPHLTSGSENFGYKSSTISNDGLYTQCFRLHSMLQSCAMQHCHSAIMMWRWLWCGFMRIHPWLILEGHSCLQRLGRYPWQIQVPTNKQQDHITVRLLSLLQVFNLIRIPEDRVTPISSNGEPSQLTKSKQSVTSTVPIMVHGDWVLFHPVYSPEELKAVQVR